MMKVLLVAVGGSIGSVLRYAASGLAQDVFRSSTFPVGTLLVNLAGATVLRGLMEYGAHSRLHTFKIERLSSDLPIVVEIVDTREKLEAFLAVIDPAISEGLATLEKAYVHFYRSGGVRPKDSV